MLRREQLAELSRRTRQVLLLAGLTGATTGLVVAGFERLTRSTSLTRSLRVSNQRFKTTTGWSPRHPSARQGWAATASVVLHP